MILSVLLCSTFFKYILLVLDARWESRGLHWPSKHSWLFYLEFTADLVRLCLYLVFFLIICTYYGLPLHLIRELGITFYNLRERVIKFLHFRQLTKNMQERFPDATQQELLAGDKTCIVCREDMEVGQTKKSAERQNRTTPATTGEHGGRPGRKEARRLVSRADVFVLLVLFSLCLPGCPAVTCSTSLAFVRGSSDLNRVRRVVRRFRCMVLRPVRVCRTTETRRSVSRPSREDSSSHRLAVRPPKPRPKASSCLLSRPACLHCRRTCKFTWTR